jgi:hypothetical protein
VSAITQKKKTHALSHNKSRFWPSHKWLTTTCEPLLWSPIIDFYEWVEWCPWSQEQDEDVRTIGALRKWLWSSTCKRYLVPHHILGRRRSLHTMHLGLMNIPDNGGVRSGPVLLVHPTGGGKSLVWDVHAIMNGGVSLTTTHLLSAALMIVLCIKKD